MRWLAILPALLLAACGGAGGAPASNPLASASGATPAAKFKIAASQTSLSNAVLWLGRDEGLWTRRGLDLDLTGANASVASKSLVAGQIDATLVGGPEALAARAAGAPVVVVAVLVPSYDHVFVTRAEVASLDQLRGKTVGVSQVASLNGAGTIAGLRLVGLEAGTHYKLVETGSNGAQQALAAQLQSHNIDAAAFEPGPAQTIGATAGLHTLPNQAIADLPLASASFVFQSNYVSSHSDAVQAAVQTLIDTVAYAAGHKAETEAALRKYFSISEQKALDDTYSDLTHAWAKKPAPAPEQFTPIVEALSRSAPELKSVDLNSLLDPRFVQQAK
ncbi:MAG TPA: ABC transporter substrate-binding protein [Chloroflexota bacterium]